VGIYRNEKEKKKTLEMHTDSGLITISQNIDEGLYIKRLDNLEWIDGISQFYFRGKE
jgi:isopenicillin N synthase-like dioxygenase